MIEDIRFLRNVVVDVDAAVVGIGRSRWTGANPDESVDAVQATMETNGFDVLPVTASPVREYYVTNEWGRYEKGVTRWPIRYEDVIPMATPIRRVIAEMATSGRTFYFLESDGHVVGLITVANLNCRQVRTYLFGLISELEMRMSELLNRDYEEVDLVACDLDKRVVGRRKKDRDKGVDAPLTEYFYFDTFASVLSELGRQAALGYEDPGAVLRAAAESQPVLRLLPSPPHGRR